jgi:hypothetical protein
MELKAKFYTPELKNRILELMESENYLPFSDSDWKAIYRNLESTNPQTTDYSEAQIIAEIEIFYNN